jgi:hypothetical protein
MPDLSDAFDRLLVSYLPSALVVYVLRDLLAGAVTTFPYAGVFTSCPRHFGGSPLSSAACVSAPLELLAQVQ